MRQINLALDSRPLGTSIFDSLDYSGLQLYGLEHLPFHLAIEDIKSVDGFRTWQIRLAPKEWNDGSPILMRDYLEGFKKLTKSFGWLHRIALRSLQSIEVSGREMEMRFLQPFARFPDVTKIPNWVPVCPGKWSGPFRLQSLAGTSEWSLSDQTGKIGSVRLVHSPLENLEAYQTKKIDVTCDTALRLENVSNAVERVDTGLFGMLTYSPDLFENESQSLTLQNDLEGVSFGSLIDEQFEKIELQKISSPAPTRGELRLAFDNFYPNQEICAKIAEHLEHKGWKIKMVEDDYYRPSQNWDFKFVILRAMANNDLLKAMTLFSLPGAKSQMSSLTKKYLEIEAGGQFQFDLYPQFRLGYPLFKVPSLYLSRLAEGNPLLRGLT